MMEPNTAERLNGTWGRHLLLFEKNPAEAPRDHDLEPLLARFTELADADVYVPGQDALWVGLDRTRSRDFVRLDLADADQRAKAIAQPRNLKYLKVENCQSRMGVATNRSWPRATRRPPP